MTDHCPSCGRFLPYTAWGPLEPKDGEEDRWEVDCPRCGNLVVEA